MFFHKKEKKEEKEYLRYTRSFCQELCSVLIPNLYRGLTIEEAWNKVKWYFQDTEQADVFQYMQEQRFSSEAMEWFISSYEEETYGGLRALFVVCQQLYHEPPDMIADVLTFYQQEIGIDSPSSLKEPVSYPYKTEQLYEYMCKLLEQRT